MSPEYSPIILQERIIEFIDSFYEKFDEGMFKDYKAGMIAKKKAGSTNFTEEASELFD